MNGTLIAAAILYLATLVTGILLHARGNPYQVVLFTFHKLLALAAVVAVAASTAGAPRGALTHPAFIASGLVAVTAGAALFISGALLSRGRFDQGDMLLVHRAAMAILTLAAPIALFLSLRDMVRH